MESNESLENCARQNLGAADDQQIQLEQKKGAGKGYAVVAFGVTSLVSALAVVYFIVLAAATQA